MSVFEPTKRADLESRLARLTSDAKPKWGRMNVAEMCCHMADSIRIAIGEKRGEDVSSYASRALLRPLAIHLLPVPKNLPTLPEMDQQKRGTPATEFESDRRTLAELLDRMCSLGDDHAWGPHGKFGPMTRKEWGKLTYKHFDHHLKQFGV
jgi:hypothetical protein